MRNRETRRKIASEVVETIQQYLNRVDLAISASLKFCAADDGADGLLAESLLSFFRDGE